jgi:hypothetical protein
VILAGDMAQRPEDTDVGDIEGMLQRARDLLKPGQDCIINTDIDGIMTALFLQEALGWKIVGLCDSKDTVWIAADGKADPSKAVFLDIFVARPSIRCIDQHIVAQDAAHAAKLAAIPTKLNPNLHRVRYASRNGKDPRSYAWKYPFGSVHFIIACLEALGHTVALPPKAVVAKGVDPIDLILRADDAARTTAENYVANARSWWGWLCGFGGSSTRALAERAQALTPESAQDAHDRLAELFRRKFGCHTNDGNFSRRLKKNGGALDPVAEEYLEKVAAWLGRPALEIPVTLTALNGTFDTAATYDTEAVAGFLVREDVFSYAFTYCMGPLAARGFSYTLWPPDGIPRSPPSPADDPS